MYYLFCVKIISIKNKQMSLSPAPVVEVKLTGGRRRRHGVGGEEPSVEVVAGQAPDVAEAMEAGRRRRRSRRAGQESEMVAGRRRRSRRAGQTMEAGRRRRHRKAGQTAKMTAGRRHRSRKH